jgi:hypothetical protein
LRVEPIGIIKAETEVARRNRLKIILTCMSE